MLVSDFDYQLPEELIAQYPSDKREESKMMILQRETGTRKLGTFTDFTDYLQAGDCLVLNDTRVIPARLFGKREGSGGKIEAFLLEEQDSPKIWQALLRPGRRMKTGAKVLIDDSREFYRVLKKNDDASFLIEFSCENVLEILEKHGKTPLPPYIDRNAQNEDLQRYQTVYAKEPGAVAAPTAGLHFTEEILQKITDKGVKIVTVTLHVGAGTFKPVSSKTIAEHKMHEERFQLTEESAEIINQCKENGGKVFCAGTTSVRVLESCYCKDSNKLKASKGKTSIFLYPPKKPMVCDALLTNFHLPKSTLLMLVCTFCEKKYVLQAYQEAIENKMRFFSYGDCMLLLP